MKRIIAMIISIMIITSTLFLTGCNFSFKEFIEDIKGIVNPQPEEPPIIELPNDELISEYKFEIVKKNFFYPTLSGILKVEFFPDNFILSFNNEEKIIEPKNVKYKNNYYEFEIESVLMYTRIRKGEYDYVLYANKDDVKKRLSEDKKIDINQELYMTEVYHFDSKKNETVMDCDDYWTGIYSASDVEIVLPPIIFG